MPKYQREREIGIENKYPWGGFYASSRSKGFQITNIGHQQDGEYFENGWGEGVHHKLCYVSQHARYIATLISMCRLFYNS